jgi:hypothetical protein
MNQLIKELALEAGGSHYPDVNTKQLIYFAELIVKECNKAVLEVPRYYKDYRSQIEDAVIEDCARAVLERFDMGEKDE